MNISSRTPEGVPNRCPVCGNELRLEPSRPPGDAPCPACGSLVWFSESGRPITTITRRLWSWKKTAVVMIWLIGGILVAGLVYLLSKVCSLGPMELIVLLILGILLFGRKLPNLGRELGRMIVVSLRKIRL